MAASISASVIISNPSTPCSGEGICDVGINMNSSVAVPVTLSSNQNGNIWDLTMSFPPTSMATLQKIRNSIYKQMTAQKPTFPFDNLALPFYIPGEVATQLWGAQAQGACVCLPADSVVTVSTDPKTQNCLVHFSYLSFGAMNPGLACAMGPVATILPMQGTFPSGVWQIGTDSYGNLIFTNGTNLIMFGAQGNMSVTRFNVTFATPPATPTAPTGMVSGNGTIFNTGTWNIGVDNLGNLAFSNGYNCISFFCDGSGIGINGNYAATTAATAAGNAIAADAASYNTGGWTIGADAMDNTGNLCFAYNNTNLYYFDATGNVYSGANTLNTDAPRLLQRNNRAVM